MLPRSKARDAGADYNHFVLKRLTRRDAGKSLLTSLAVAPAISAATRHPLGFQVYTVRNLIPSHARETLRRIAAIGYREAEVVQESNSIVLPLCKEFGIQAISGHFATPLVTGNFDAWKTEFPTGASAGLTWQKVSMTRGRQGLSTW